MIYLLNSFAQVVPKYVSNNSYFSPFLKFCRFYVKLANYSLLSVLPHSVLQTRAGTFWTPNSQPFYSQDPFNQTLIRNLDSPLN